MTFKKPIKIIAAMLVVAFTITFGLPTQQLAQAMQQEQQEQTVQSQKEALAKSYEKPTTQTKLGSFADELYKWYETLKSDIDANDMTKFQADQKSAIEALKSLRSEIDTEFSNNEKILEKLNAKNAQQRQQEFKAQINSKMDSFEALFQSLGTTTPKKLKSSALKSSANSTANTANDLKNKLQEIGKTLKPEQQEQPLGALPHNNVSVNPPSPATGSESSAAYISTTSGAITSDLPKTPTAEDLAETEEVTFSQDIKTLADSLNTSVKIYEYVKNNINFEPYYGSRKGSVGTLNQMSGNNYDQASLLISMLRYKGIPSRYVTGTVEIPIKKAQAWVGTETPEAAVKVLGSMGIPSVAMVSGGVISAIRIEHVWVEAYVPYENYRGIGKGAGKKIWVPLDASFKQYTKKKGLDIGSITGVNQKDIENAFQRTGVVSPDKNAISRISTDTMQQKLAEQKTAIENYLNKNSIENPKWNDIYGGYEIVPQKLGMLPLTLQYKTIAVLGENRTIESKLKDTITFSISGSDPYGLNFETGNDFEYTANAAEIYGKKLTLSWTPASSEDDAIIKQYGSIFKTPAYMVQLKPVLKADGVAVATGKAVGMGYRQQFTIAMNVPGQAGTENVVNAVTAGSYYCIGLDYGAIAPDELNSITDKLKALKASINEKNIYSDEAMGEILNAVAKTYFGELDTYNKMLESQYGVKSSRLLSEGMTGYNAAVKYLFMTPVELSEGSMYIDVDRDVHSVVSLTGDKNAEKAFMLSSGIISSSMEHVIFEQMFNTPSVSTIRILSEANRMGIPVYTVDKSNLAAVLPKLDVTSTVKTDITNSVNAGKKVTIPQRNIRYFDWTGTGYVVLDPATGAAAYMISGGTAGGSMSISQMLSEYVEQVISGLLFIVMIELAEAIAIALLPGVGWIAATFMVVKLVLMADYIYNLALTASMYYATGDTYYLQELIVQLAAFATLGLIAKPLSEKISDNINTLDRMAKSEQNYYNKAAADGYSREAATDYYQKYGTDNISKAQDTLDTFKKEGVSNENVSKAGENLDSNGIDAYKDIIKDNSGKFDNTDQTKVLDLLEKCENKAEYDTLKNSVDTLEKYNIEPSEYETEGIKSPEAAEAAAKSEVIADNLTQDAEVLESTAWRGTEVVNGVTIVTDVGAFGEHIAADMLVQNGWSDFTYIKNGSDNGIDIIARSADGHLGFFEVKTSSTGTIPDLSSRQANMNVFVEDVLSKAANGNSPYSNIDPATQSAARNVYNEYVADPYNISGNVIGVDLKSGTIKVSRWYR